MSMGMNGDRTSAAMAPSEDINPPPNASIKKSGNGLRKTRSPMGKMSNLRTLAPKISMVTPATKMGRESR